MMISALPPLRRRARRRASPVSSAVTVTTALTSRPPAGRYGFWSMSTVNPGRLVIAVSSASLLSPGGHIHVRGRTLLAMSTSSTRRSGIRLASAR